jgi:DNA gyrase/topoisomerase IV subunit B
VLKQVEDLEILPLTCTYPGCLPSVQKKSQLEHILLRPDTYIGSTEKQQQQLWVHDGDRMVLQSIGYVPGLYKIFDEILVNAADNKVRDPSMDTVRVSIDEVGLAVGMGTAVPYSNAHSHSYFYRA